MDHCEKCMRPLTAGKVCPVCGVLPAAPIHHLKPGAVLKGRYCVGRAFEETGKTVTYAAKDLESDLYVAVQEYFPAGRVSRDHTVSNQVSGMQTQQQALRRMLEKARILRRFNEEPGVVHVSDVFEENETGYLVMERPGGITLQTYLSKAGRIGARALLEGMAPMMQTLQKLHESGLIHRRISPETVRLYTDGTVKLVDFGTAGESLEKRELKHGYAPAEQYELRDRSDPRSDIYSLCATIYAAITGNRLPPADRRAAGDTVVEPSRYGADVTPRQEAALLQGLQIEADRRLGSVKALMSALGMEIEEPQPAVPEMPQEEAEPEQTFTETVELSEIAENPESAAEAAEEIAEPAEEAAAASEEEPLEMEFAEELAPDEQVEEVLREEKSAERKGFSWKELLALAKVDEQEDAWDDFIETTLEKPKEEPVDPVFGQGRMETVVPTEPVQVITEELDQEPEEEPVQPEFAEDMAPADVDFGVDEMGEEPETDKKMLGRRIAMGIMALIAVIGVVCAVWMTRTAAADAEPCAVVTEI